MGDDVWRSIPESMPGTQNPPEKALCCLVQGIIEDTNTGIYPEPIFLLDLRIATGNREDAPWCLVGCFYLAGTKKWYSYPPQKARVLFLQQLSVAGTLHLYGALTTGWVYKCPQHILGYVLRCVNYPRILCQTGMLNWYSKNAWLAISALYTGRSH